jgi:hypothetical protein
MNTHCGIDGARLSAFVDVTAGNGVTVRTRCGECMRVTLDWIADPLSRRLAIKDARDRQRNQAERDGLLDAA